MFFLLFYYVMLTKSTYSDPFKMSYTLNSYYILFLICCSSGDCGHLACTSLKIQKNHNTSCDWEFFFMAKATAAASTQQDTLFWMASPYNKHLKYIPKKYDNSFKSMEGMVHDYKA